MKKTLIIAEAGVNHNGSVAIAKKLIDAAAAAGVDYVKFQTFKAENLVTKIAPQADYQQRNIGGGDNSQYNMLKKLELSEDDHIELIEYCKAKRVTFFSTAFDLDSITFLAKLNMPMWKIPSGELTNFPYLRAIGHTRNPAILSTGMADMNDIQAAIEVLVRFGTPRKQITLLHCTTEYPAPKNEVNLRAMETMRNHFDLPTGYSDHTQGIEIPIAAVALGAVVIEKHFTLDRNMDGPDHKASLEPDELKTMVEQIRNIEAALGNGVKEPAHSEMKNKAIARKSIVASRNIREGEEFSDENLTAKRPGNGISPMCWMEICGQLAKRDFKMDDPIEL